MQVLPSRNILFAAGLALATASSAYAQTSPPSPAAAEPDLATITNLWRVPSPTPIPYPPAEVADIEAVMRRVLDYLETASPVIVTNTDTKERVADFTKPLPRNLAVERGPFLIVSYEWGVTYAGMLHAAAATGDARYTRYTDERLTAIAALAKHFSALPPAGRPQRYLLRSVVAPASLDDSGAMAAGMIKALQARATAADLRPIIDRYLAHISGGQKRLADGTLARDRPMPDSLWLDDLYMSVPALAQMGRLTGDARYFDDAAQQILQFHARMFVPAKNLFMHGWVAGMTEHPAYHWGRANGWAILATVELLSVLPDAHPRRPALLAILRDHARGLAATQGINGLWHQLLDRPETYEETSASAMFVYGLARAINRGWLDPLVYGPVASIGWNAVAKQVNARGQVENVCVGTGMGFDPVFYAYRNTSPYAAHGYGPVLLAGAEMITLRKGLGADAVVHDGGVHFGKVPTRLW
ncbi:glycoside hydrolase family 88 protein [Termitidicoccus mucosus]|uniref:Glycosyl hydrolase family 88 n=1 Tax=Termitidicoccus mucosus TaxID=1184151 RepID=A0A178ICY7_9BACT|nr:glycosyl hydrolase family 88 [Opitutaceae bacterium TSB47]